MGRTDRRIPTRQPEPGSERELNAIERECPFSSRSRSGREVSVLN